jgi:hypothetical protein
MFRPALRNYLKIAIVISIVITWSQLLFAQTKFKSLGGNKVESAETYFEAEARKVIPASVLAADKTSANSIGNVLTILLDDAKVSLQSESDPLVGIWVGTVVVPTRAGAGTGPKSYLQHVRGFVGKDKDSTVTILLRLGGKTHLISFGYGVKVNGNILRKLVTPAQPKSTSYTVSIAVLVERRTATSAVQVNIDSLDVDAKGRVGTKNK